MIVKYGEQQPVEVNSGTIGGVQINVLLVAAAANTGILPSDFLPQNVQITAQLRRAGQLYTIYNDNLLLLGTYFTRLRNLFWFYYGHVLIPPAAGVYANQLLTAFLKFDSPVVLGKGDILTVKVNNQVGCMSANINTATSYVEFIVKPTVGGEFGVPCTTMEVVQQNVSSGTFINADKVCRADFLNFDQSSLVNVVVSTLALSSAEYSHNATFNQLLGDEAEKTAMVPPYQFAATTTAGSPSVYRINDVYPQSFRLWPLAPHEGCQHLLTRCKATFTFNTGNVNASQNWVGSTRLIMSAQHIAKLTKAAGK